MLAPFVGAFADALPKGKVMFVGNTIKVVGCLMMLFGAHPLLAYAIVGLGAAAYSPAKYGILTELLPPSQLVKANGWIEGLTIGSVILGILLGGQLVGHTVSARAAGPRPADHRHRHRHRARRRHRGDHAAVPARRHLQPATSRAPKRRCSRFAHGPMALVRDFSQCNARLWNDKLGQISLATTTLFWGIGGNMRVIVFPWAAAALGYSIDAGLDPGRRGGRRHRGGRHRRRGAHAGSTRPPARSRWASPWACSSPG